MSDLDARLARLSPEQRELYERLLREQEQEAENTFPLSVFQQGMWFLEQLRPNNPAYVVPGAVRIRGPLRTDLLVDSVNEIVRRHEALRTTFEVRAGRPMQVVHARMPVELPEVDLRDAGLTAAELEARVVAEALGTPPGPAEPGQGGAHTPRPASAGGAQTARPASGGGEPGGRAGRGSLDIEAGPLLRLVLLRTGDDEAVLVLAMHHLVSDRWSIGIMLAELAALYEAASRGLPSPLPEPAIQYGDFATWQQEQLERGRWAADLEYWREHLAGAPAALELPTDRPRPAVQGFNGDFVPIDIPKALMSRLAAVANGRGATTYMALLAAFTVLLHRYGNTDDVVVGVPTAVRDREEVAALIGYFVNALPIRTRLAGEPTFTEVLDQVRAASLAAYGHQEVPFDVVVAELKLPRDLSRPPVFQVSFSYGREPDPTFALGDAELTRMWVKSGGARFDLELQTFDRDGSLAGWIEYDRDLFDESTITRMAGHYRQLIEQIAADPERRVDELELLGPEERHRILADFNDTAREWPAGRGWIHRCFADQARLTPDAPAVRFEGAELSYAELDRRANQLAHRLIRSGVGRDVLVGVAMERSLELVVSLLAVLKAGGAYVPLDPGYPKARLEHMVSDARVPVLLTSAAVRPVLPPVSAEVLCVDALAAELAGEPGDDPDVPVGGDDLAYVIYTSGSTGNPKGVMNTHAGIRNRLLWMQEAFGLDHTDRVLQKTPFSFDVSVWEFFWPLMVGSTLVVARPQGHRDPAYLSRVIRDEQITTIHFVPSMLQVFLTEPVRECTSLRRVICSGEALPRDLQDRFLASSDAQLHNLYGPTEAAIDVTHWQCGRDDPPGTVPIGRAIANTQIYVLDRHLRPVPIGVAGELHIGGVNLARGYLNRPELTAERFVPDPFAAAGPPDPAAVAALGQDAAGALDPAVNGPAADGPAADGPAVNGPAAADALGRAAAGTAGGPRLYKTGDLARFRPDGAVEFLGRLDHQVKLRGFRVELGEIEAALAEHPLVREAVVVAREHRPGDVRLVAYLSTVSGEPRPEPTALMDALRQRLPEHMVPAVFEVLDEFPLTPNGKVDRKALPEPAALRPGAGAAYVAPRDELEDTLAGLWRKVLGADRVGRDDNFFDLGGHSLLMAELRVVLVAELGRDVSMVELFQHPTVASLAGYLSRPAGAAGGGGEPDGPGAAQDAARERAENRRQAAARRQQVTERRARFRQGPVR